MGTKFATGAEYNGRNGGGGGGTREESKRTSVKVSTGRNLRISWVELLVCAEKLFGLLI